MGIFKRKSKLSTDTMDNGVRLVTADKPKDVVAEQFRTLRTNIDFSSVDQKMQVLIFTSSNVSEGKSTVSANTAVTWAQQGKKVLLLGADLRRPTLHTTFSLMNTNGLTTVLSKDTDFHEVVEDSGVDNLSVITSGPVPPNPAELLNSKRMAALLLELRKEFDMIILDVPPMLSVTDTQILAAKVDGVVLVVRQGVAQKAAVQRSLELLKLGNANVLGYIFNDVSGHTGYGYGYE